MPYLFPYGVNRLFRVDFGYRDSDNPKTFDAVFFYLANNDLGNAAELA